MNFFEKFSGKQITWFSMVIIGCFFLYHYVHVFDYKPDLNGDNAIYYSLSKALLEGKGYTNIIPERESPHTHFPPGYPAFGALVLFFFKSYFSLKVANGVLLFCSIVLLFFFVRRITRSPLVALGSALLCCMQPELLRFSTIVMSEMLYTFLSLAVLYLASCVDVHRLFGRSFDWRHGVGFVLLLFGVCYVYLVRTMGASLTLAVLLFYTIRWLQQGREYLQTRKRGEELSYKRRQLLGYVLVLCLLVGTFGTMKSVWDARNRAAGLEQSDYLKDFKRKPQGEQMATFEDWVQRVGNNALEYTTKWIPSAVMPYAYEAQRGASPGDWARGLFVVGLMLWGLVRLRRLQLLVFLYVGITMGVLLIWPEQYAGHRYFVGVIPLFICLFLNGIVEAAAFAWERVRALRTVKWIPSGLLVAVVVFVLMPRYAQGLEKHKYLAQYKVWDERVAPAPFVEYLYAVDWCTKNLPATAKIACRKADLFYLFSGGRKAESFPQYGKPGVVFNGFKNAGITHVIIDRWFRHGYATIYPLISEYYPECFRPLIQIGKNNEHQLPTLIFEFNPDGFPEE